MAPQADDSPIFGPPDEPTATSTSTVSGPVSGPSTSASSVRVVLTADAWRPQGDPMREFELNPNLWDCYNGGTEPGRFIKAYTMMPGQEYTFDASRLVSINQTVYAFELHAVLYSLASNEPIFSGDRRYHAILNGDSLPPSEWDVPASQRCVNVQWRVNLTGSVDDLRTGTFTAMMYFDSPPLLMYVISAALIAQSETAHNNTALTISAESSASTSDSSAPTAASSNSSSLPRIGVIVPAILIPALAVAALVVAFVMWRKRQQRRMRLAPSAAFRHDHAATIARGVEGRGGGSPVPSNKNAYFPLDDKRPFNFSSSSS